MKTNIERIRERFGTKVERIRKSFEKRGCPMPTCLFTDEEVLKIAEGTFEGNCVLSGIIWEDAVIELKQSLPKWIKRRLMITN